MKIKKQRANEKNFMSCQGFSFRFSFITFYLRNENEEINKA
jgi:hypothetical protein